MPSSLRQIGFVAFGAAALALLVLSAMAYRSMVRLNEANDLVTHTYRVMSALENALTTMVDAETGTRGYGITGLTRYLEPFDRANREIDQRIDALASLTADNPAHRQLAAALRTQTRATMVLLQQIVALGQSHRPIPIDLRDREKASMDAVRATLQRMRTQEQQLMEQRELSADRAEAATQAFMLGLAAMAFGVLTLSFRLVVRHAAQLREVNARLNDRVQSGTAELRQRTVQLETALTSEQAARQEAQDANRAKDEFLMTISHELRTPLTTIYGWSRMLATGRLQEGQRPRALEAIYHAAEMQSRLINDLLDTSRMLSGKLQLNLDFVDISQIARTVVDGIEPEARAKSIRLDANVDDGVYLSGDADRLRQVVGNLLSNAVKFTPRGGHVTLRLERKVGDVEITVIDDGQGIAPDFLPFVFDRFRQADSSSTRARGGLGLGLAIVRSVVELHGGSIEAHSEGVGRGATVRVRLPVAMPELSGEGIGAAARAHDASTPLEGIRVLVVDDEAHTRELLTTVLEDAGADVRAANGVAAALDVITTWEPTVLLSDIAMPGEDGYSLIRKVRAGSGMHVRAIAITAYAGVDDRTRALKSGYDLHVAKPVEPATLVTSIADLVAAAAD